MRFSWNRAAAPENVNAMSSPNNANTAASMVLRPSGPSRLRARRRPTSSMTSMPRNNSSE
jgi:hypothetical protein